MSFFEGILEDDSRSPKSWYKVKGTDSVFVNPDRGLVTITAVPNRFHSCDRRGCGSFEHRIATFGIPESQDIFYPIRKEVIQDD